jgi:hypothetical protein
MTVREDTEDTGAPCGFCWHMLFAYCPDCRICKLRPFGSAPCLNDLPEYQDCPGNDRCPNGDVCIEIAQCEFPLARIALAMKKGAVI